MEYNFETKRLNRMWKEEKSEFFLFLYTIFFFFFYKIIAKLRGKYASF